MSEPRKWWQDGEMIVQLVTFVFLAGVFVYAVVMAARAFFGGCQCP